MNDGRYATKAAPFLWTTSDMHTRPPSVNIIGGASKTTEDCVEALCAALAGKRTEYENQEPADPSAAYRKIIEYYNEMPAEQSDE